MRSFINGEPVSVTGRMLRCPRRPSPTASVTVCRWMADGVEHQLRGGACRAGHRTADQAEVVAQRVEIAERSVFVHLGFPGAGPHGLDAARFLGEVEQMHGDLNTAHPVGERVVELAQHRRPAVVEALYQSCRPQRPGPVEVRHRCHPSHLQHTVEVARFGGRHFAQMEVDVEVRGGFHRGGAGGGDSRTRSRQIGSACDSAPKRSRTTSQSGERSSGITVTTVERSRASDSIAQVKASVWLMKSVIVTPRYDASAVVGTGSERSGDFVPTGNGVIRWTLEVAPAPPRRPGPVFRRQNGRYDPER